MIRIRPAARLSLQAKIARARLTPWPGISFFAAGNEMERVKGIEPSYSAWKPRNFAARRSSVEKQFDGPSRSTGHSALRHLVSIDQQ
jgi:hypothetical protein